MRIKSVRHVKERPGHFTEVDALTLAVEDGMYLTCEMPRVPGVVVGVGCWRITGLDRLRMTLLLQGDSEPPVGGELVIAECNEQPAYRLERMVRRVLYRGDEVLARDPAGQIIMPADAVIVRGISARWGMHPERLAAQRAELEGIIREVVRDDFLRSKGCGASFTELCMDREGQQWGEQSSIELLVVLAIGLGMAGYLTPPELWKDCPGGVPIVWFADPPEEAPPRLWKKGEPVRITMEGQTVDGEIVMASENGRSLALAYEAILGGFVGMMPVLFERGAFRDLAAKRPVTLAEVV